jgi:pimeloyl-ACP methyl ester carboxylesterase
MKPGRLSGLLAALALAVIALTSGTIGTVAASTPRARSSSRPPAPRVVEMRAADGTVLKASYFAADRPGPGVLLFHQSNRTRRSWDDFAARLAAAGIHTLAVDLRGHGESGGKEGRRNWPGDIDAAFRFLVSQPGVTRDVIGAGGAGVLGVEIAVEAARRHPAEVRSLALLCERDRRAGPRIPQAGGAAARAVRRGRRRRPTAKRVG